MRKYHAPIWSSGRRSDSSIDCHNRDIGHVTRVDTEEGVITLSFDGREVTYDFGELDEVSLAYTATVHKSQGSEYPAIVIPMAT